MFIIIRSIYRTIFERANSRHGPNFRHQYACEPKSLLVLPSFCVRAWPPWWHICRKPAEKRPLRGCICQEAKGKCTSDHVEGAPGTGRRVGVLPYPSLALAGHSRHAFFWAPASRWFRTSARPSALALVAPHQRLPGVVFLPIDSRTARL